MSLTAKNSTGAGAAAAAVLLAAVALLLWLVNRPYGGFNEHDARIYAVLAMHWIEPAAYARDPFFMFGSQDDYSLFSPLYGSLIRLLGLAQAAKVVVFCGGILWIGAAMALAWRLFEDSRARWFAVLLCAVVSLGYSPNGATFVLNENFATARSFAFALAVMALARAIAQRPGQAVVLAVVATGFHPLIGIWVLLAIIASRMSDRTLLAAIAALVAGVALAALVSWPPLRVMAADWEQIVRASSRDVFVGTWGEMRLNEYLLSLGALLWAATLRADGLARWYRIVALIGACGLLAAQLTSYFLPLQLPIQAQLWRAMWLAVYCSLFAAVDVAWRVYRLPDPGRLWLLVAALILHAFASYAGFLLLLSWLSLRGPVRELACDLVGRSPARSRQLALALLLGLVALAAPAYLQEVTVRGLGIAPAFQIGLPLLDGFFLAGGLGLGLLMLALALPRLGRLTWIPLILVAPALYFAVAHWDQRLEKYRKWESLAVGTAAVGNLAQIVGRGAVVLWLDNSPIRVWLEIGTASYASSVQAIGVVFSRDKTRELARRLRRVAVGLLADAGPLAAGTAEHRFMESRRQLAATGENPLSLHAGYVGNATLGPAGLAYVCADAALDWVVVRNDLSPTSVRPVPASDALDGTPLYLYRCAEVRAAGTPEPSARFGHSML